MTTSDSLILAGKADVDALRTELQLAIGTISATVIDGAVVSGDLTGTLPSPEVKSDAITEAKLDPGVRDKLNSTTVADNLAAEVINRTAGDDALRSSISSMLINGKLDPSLLPALAIGETFVVTSEAEMLALTAQQGDIAKRTDIDGGAPFILQGTDPTVLGNWLRLTGDFALNSDLTAESTTRATADTSLNGLIAMKVTKTGDEVIAGGKTFTGQVAFGGGSPNARSPFNSNQAIDALTTGTIDKVGHGLDTTITGDLSLGTGSNPTWVWGLNVFTITGPNANDGKGGNIQNLIESDVAAASGTIAVVQGLMVEAAFYGAASGATVTQMESLRVAAPKRKEGATAGTATSAVSLFVEDVNGTAVGASSAFSLFVAGGVSRFGGRVDVANTIANNGSGALEMLSEFSRSAGATIQLDKNTGGGSTGSAKIFLSKAASVFAVSDGTTNVVTLGRDGTLVTTGAITAGGNVGITGTLTTSGVFTANGNINAGNNAVTARSLIITDTAVNGSGQGRVTIWSNATGANLLTLRGYAGQTGDLQLSTDSAGVQKSVINANGTWVSDVAAGGIVLKDTAGHYWRTTVSTTGALTTTDLGTTRPTT